jgi:Ca2+-binding RTX toxin-like protein
MITRIRVSAGDQPDAVNNSTDRPSSLSGDGGLDVLVGGPREDTMTGGSGHDSLIGARGNDLILARDGADDNVDCGGNERDRAELDPLPLDNGLLECKTVTRR